MKNYYTLRRVGFWNCAVVVIFVGALAYVWCASLGAPMRVVALDRAQVFDMPNLTQFDPLLAAHVRTDLGNWIAEKERDAAYTVVWLGLLAAVINVVVCFWCADGNRE